MALLNWLNGDNWLAIKNKFFAVVELLNGGTDGQVLRSNGDPNTASWETLSDAEIPGGNVGDILRKQSATENDYAWNSPDFGFVGLELSSNVSNQDCAVRKSITGTIELRGRFIVPFDKTEILFTLGDGYRPPRTINYACVLGPSPGSRVAWIYINSSGEARLDISLITSGNVVINLDGITFHP